MTVRSTIGRLILVFGQILLATPGFSSDRARSFYLNSNPMDCRSDCLQECSNQQYRCQNQCGTVEFNWLNQCRSTCSQNETYYNARCASSCNTAWDKCTIGCPIKHPDASKCISACGITLNRCAARCPIDGSNLRSKCNSDCNNKYNNDLYKCREITCTGINRNCQAACYARCGGHLREKLP